MVSVELVSGGVDDLKSVRIISAMAENSSPMYLELAQYLGWRTGYDVSMVETIAWPEREALLYNGEMDFGFICGLPYVLKTASVDLVAAPVMAEARYLGRPVYYSDVVVRRQGPVQRFADLRGGSWAINEPGSHSGFNITRYQLARMGEADGFFSRVVASGAHQKSLRMVISGEIDASAIDSTVLELELSRYPELAGQIRIVETLGPSPIPPFVAAKRVAPEVKAAIGEAITTMHRDPAGRGILANGLVGRYAAIVDADYDEIRRMTKLAMGVALGVELGCAASPSCRVSLSALAS